MIELCIILVAWMVLGWLLAPLMGRWLRRRADRYPGVAREPWESKREEQRMGGMDGLDSGGENG